MARKAWLIIGLLLNFTFSARITYAQGGAVELAKAAQKIRGALAAAPALTTRAALLPLSADSDVLKLVEAYGQRTPEVNALVADDPNLKIALESLQGWAATPPPEFLKPVATSSAPRLARSCSVGGPLASTCNALQGAIGSIYGRHPIGAPSGWDMNKLLEYMKEPISAAYLGILETPDRFVLAIEKNGEITFEDIPRTTNPRRKLMSWIDKYSRDHRVKFIGAGIDCHSPTCTATVRSKLWFDKTIVPIRVDGKTHEILTAQARVPFAMSTEEFPALGSLASREGSLTAEQNTAVQLLTGVRSQFNDENIVQVRKGAYNEVLFSELGTKADFRAITANPTLWDRLTAEADAFRGKKMMRVNSTAQGGGVALMNHDEGRTLRTLDTDFAWHNIDLDLAEGGADRVTAITKGKIHNGMQNVGDPNAFLTDADVEFMRDFSQKAFDQIKPALAQADVIVIDDPQPAGLIPLIKAEWPDKPVIYRSHTQLLSPLIHQEGTRAHAAWYKWVWPNAQHADVFVSHPIESFVPRDVPKDKLVYMQPTTGYDGLNKHVSEWDAAYYFQELNKQLTATGQPALDPSKPYIAQIARFDPSKGVQPRQEAERLFSDVLESYQKYRALGGTYDLALVGHGSVDDPEGSKVFHEVYDTLYTPGSPLYEQYRDLAPFVHAALLPHVDHLLQVTADGARNGLQLSLAEGWEIKVTEQRRAGNPMVVYNAGGIPLQIDAGTGFILDIGDTDGVARALYRLESDPALYAQMSEAARSVPDAGFTPANDLNWLYMSNRILRPEGFHPNGRLITDLVETDPLPQK